MPLVEYINPTITNVKCVSINVEFYNRKNVRIARSSLMSILCCAIVGLILSQIEHNKHLTLRSVLIEVFHTFIHSFIAFDK